MNSNKMKKYIDIGLKLTPQRLAILEYIDGNKEHPSAEDIYKAVSVNFPTMSFATVYNTLETLRQRGKVMCLSIDPNKKRFDPNTEPHHHLICTKCKKVADVHAEFNLDIPEKLNSDFHITGNHIEFYGVCSDCRKSADKEK
jgi:Fur family transcriptional regulator, peroxide stress response regulator